MKLSEALRPFDKRLLGTTEGRIALTKHDPLLFAAIYMPHKLQMPGQSIADVSLCDFHFAVIDYAKSWTHNLDAHHTYHDCFVGPRMTGKSTWLFHILPIWAGAHLHKTYIIGFSDSDTQAKQWLMNFKTEIANNSLLEQDFPGLTNAAKLGTGARAYMDNRNITKRDNGFVFQVAGADSNVLGANVGGIRPQVLLFDDIEPTESNYSEHEAKKRLNTLLSAHFYLNPYAIKAFVGTTTMPDSIIDQIRKVGEQRETYVAENGNDDGFRNALDQQYRWVVDAGINCHYYPAIVSEADGTEKSLWPEMWSMDELNAKRHTREFAMNMMNRPVSLDGGYWEEEDILVDEPTEFGNTIISIDPAVTTKRTSDYTGIAVVSRGKDDKLLYVRHAEQTRMTSEQLRDHVNTLVKAYNAKVVYVETNQGGDLWRQVFAGVSAKYRSMRQTEKKEVRAGQAHDYYKKGQVKHTRHFPALEEQMLAFPRVPHDDVLDAVTSAVLYFKRSRTPVRARQINYQEV